jgi:hypothetical protein
MTHSFNEIEALCKGAARGAGLPWGLAEEAAKAVRWLSAFDLPGAKQMTDLLEMNDHIPVIDVSPVSLKEEIWHSAIHRMCPLSAGAALSDCAERLFERGRITMENVSSPLLTVPFMGHAALHLGVPIAVMWEGAHLATDGRKLSLLAVSKEALSSKEATRVVFTAPAQMASSNEPVLRASLDETVYAQLKAFAHRNFAPATEASRLKGAGAGISDND